jgi:ketosteroid isomerase-like protein
MSKSRRSALARVIGPLALGLFWMLAVPLTAQEMTPDEQAVWKLEEQYWVYVRNSDLEGYRTLWDDRFVGWPSFSPKPVGKGSIGEWIPPLHADSEQKFQYTLEPMAVRSFGDVVVAHYLVKERWVSAKTGQVTRSEAARITHTWQRKGDGWVIITGMSSAQ